MNRCPVLVLTLVAGTACGGAPLGDDQAVQIAAMRDVEVRLGRDGWWLGDSAVFLRNIGGENAEVWRSRLDGVEPELLDRGPNQDTWFIRDGSGAPRSVAIAGAGTFTITPLDGQPRMTIGRNTPVDTSVGILGIERCVVLTVQGGTVGSGPCNYVTAQVTSLVVFDLIDGGDGHAIVTGWRAFSGSTDTGIYDIAPDGKVTTLVSPALTDYDVPPGFERPGALVSSTVSRNRTVSRSCWPGGCFLLYMRTMEDRRDRPFAYMLESGREVALPGDPGWHVLWKRWQPAENPRLVLWATDTDEKGLTVGAWNVETGAARDCNLSHSPGATEIGYSIRGDGNALAVQAGLNAPTSFMVVPASADGCALVTTPAWSPQFSPDSSAVVWYQPVMPADSVDGTWEIWMADGLGHSPHLITSVPNLETADLVAPDTLLVRFGVLDGTVLAVLDPTASTPVLRPLASQSFGELRLVGQRRLLAGTDVNADDGNGNLSLIDLDSGEKQVLATGVNWFETAPEAVIYTVRGRYSSSKDGLWLGRLP